jgi:trimethylamine:corrinoid methyltransferase-like protein
MMCDSTLDHYRELYWYPRLFQHGLGLWKDESAPDLRRRARATFHEQLARYDYELEAAKRNELWRIWQRAVAELR